MEKTLCSVCGNRLRLKLWSERRQISDGISPQPQSETTSQHSVVGSSCLCVRYKKSIQKLSQESESGVLARVLQTRYWRVHRQSLGPPSEQPLKSEYWKQTENKLKRNKQNKDAALHCWLHDRHRMILTVETIRKDSTPVKFFRRTWSAGLSGNPGINGYINIRVLKGTWMFLFTMSFHEKPMIKAGDSTFPS